MAWMTKISDYTRFFNFPNFLVFIVALTYQTCFDKSFWGLFNLTRTGLLLSPRVSQRIRAPDRQPMAQDNQK